MSKGTQRISLSWEEWETSVLWRLTRAGSVVTEKDSREVTPLTLHETEESLTAGLRRRQFTKAVLSNSCNVIRIVNYQASL